MLTALALAGCVRGLGPAATLADTATPADTSTPADIADAVADAPVAACALELDPATIALYRFEDADEAILADETGHHPGTVVQGAGRRVQRVAGPPLCGKGLAVPALGDAPPPNGATDAYGLIPDSPDWDLAEGSIELWVRFDTDVADQPLQVVLSRDFLKTPAPGHLTIARCCDGRLFVRIQPDVQADDGLCSAAPLEQGRFYHLAINLGGDGAELYLDGERQHGTGTLPAPTTPLTCVAALPLSIAGNDLPWIIGAGGQKLTTLTPKPSPVVYPLGGVVDSLRISSVRRAFSSEQGK